MMNKEHWVSHGWTPLLELFLSADWIFLPSFLHNPVSKINVELHEKDRKLSSFLVVFHLAYLLSICKSSFCHLRNLSRIRKYLTRDSATVVVHAFVTSKVDYCNALLCYLAKYRLQKLQYVQNTAARVVYQISIYHTCFTWASLAPDSVSYCAEHFAASIQIIKWSIA